MNRWQCQHPGCKHECIGVGGAVGLRAIGWYFERGPVLLCPAHRPDPVPCHDRWSTENHGKPCALCAADDVAEDIQEQLATPEERS